MMEVTMTMAIKIARKYFDVESKMIYIKTKRSIT